MSRFGKRMYSLQSTDDSPANVYRTLRKRSGDSGSWDSFNPLEPSGSQRSVVRARKKSEFYVKDSFESLNYRPITNQIELEMQKRATFRSVKTQASLRIGLFLLTGALTAFIGVLMELAIGKLGHFKYDTFESIAIQNFHGSFHEFLKFLGYRFVGVVVPVMVGAALVTFIAPYAAGGGVAQCIGYLNGIRVPNILSIKGLVVKALSTVCTVISGLAGGKEGPMMHMGTISGGSLPSALPCVQFKLDCERRDFAAAGFGAGIAVAFGAPVGGLLLALEEGVSFLELSLMWKIYLCCVFSYALGAIFISLVHDGEVNLNNSELQSLGFISSDVTEYSFFELIPFAVMAVIGGLIGALLIKIHVSVALFRDRYIKTKTRKMIVAFIAACIVVIFHVSAIWMMRSCSVLPRNTTCVTCHHKLYCPEGERSDMSLMFSKTQGDLLRLFFGPDVLQMSSLGLFSAIYFILMCITMGLSISAGIFIPQVILGAAWGRLFGTFLKHLVNDAEWAKPAKYAYLGAAAQLSGTVGKTFSILVIFVEASRSITLSFPLMVIVSITRLVCTFFVLPIYETQMHIMGLPFLPYNPPPLDCDVPTTRYMSPPPLVTLPPSLKVAAIIDTLKGNNHNGYPIVETKRGENESTVLVGLILRQQLLILLKYHAYKYPTPTTNRQMCECYETYIRDSRTRLNVQKIIDGVEQEYYEYNMDLSPYYNIFPPTVAIDMPLIKTYEYFRSLGVRHLVVITKKYEPIGMVTRKDLAKFHTVESFCAVKVKEMIIKS